MSGALAETAERWTKLLGPVVEETADALVVTLDEQRRLTPQVLYSCEPRRLPNFARRPAVIRRTRQRL